MRVLILLFILLPVFAFCAQTGNQENLRIKNITAQTTKMSPDSLKNLFDLKEGDVFNEESYQKAKEKLENLRIFKTLDFLYKKKKDGIDIHIKADDKSYVLPMLFAFSSTKRAFGISLESGNIFKHGEELSISLGTSKKNFYTHSNLKIGKNNFYMDFNKLDFNQCFYKDGWSSLPGVYISDDDTNKYNENLLAEVKTKKDSFSFSYTHKISNLWQFSITPQYEYYFYQGYTLDSGKHNNISFSIGYTDNVDASINMNALTRIDRRKKEYFLKNLTNVRQGKMLDLSYTNGGTWTGSDYKIQKLSLSGTYLLEFKTRHRLALFAKGIKAFRVPFSNQVESSDLLFGLGIYDREQRGKAGFSCGISFDYFILKNQVGFLSLMPFYEQAYIKTLENNYNPHSGIGGILTYQFWGIQLPISLNYTHNLNDSSHHFGIRIGGHL